MRRTPKKQIVAIDFQDLDKVRGGIAHGPDPQTAQVIPLSTLRVMQVIPV